MGYNTKNYTEQGGEKTVIGGEVVIKGKVVVEEGAQVEGLPSTPKAENQADSEASSVALLKADFNALLAKLKAAGLMEADPETPAENPVETPTENN